jgi:hypothetical protein
MIDAQLAERARLQAERKRRNRQAYEERNPGRKDKNHNPGRLKYHEYPFVMWDGEAPKDTGYSLFGSSSGYRVCHPGLETEECFDLLLEAKRDHPETIHFIFGGRYDFDEIARQSIPLDRLSRLKTTGHCTWHGYTIKQAEGKFFTLKKNRTSITVWEIFTWFRKAYVKALADYQIGTVEELAFLSSEKARRNEFLWQEIKEIETYWKLELKLGPPLMERIREICLAAGFNPRAWYGPSALALELLRKNNIQDCIGPIPDHVQRAAQYAFAGGRFEQFQGGIFSNPYIADKNSAYVSAALDLPNLSHGNWRHGRDFEPGKFGVYHIRYNSPVDPMDRIRLYPLFCRHSNGAVDWPHKVDGWYWTPEAELVKDDEHATFLESYIFDEQDKSDRPFRFVEGVYHKRMVLKKLQKSNPSRKAEKAFKWALASIYGQLARSVGWDRFKRRPPRYHCLAFAGYITSSCRAEMYRVAKTCGDKLISIDTDSVSALCPLHVTTGVELGQWEENVYDRGVFFQSGITALEKDGEWVEVHRRGIEDRRGRPPVSPEMMISAIYDGRPIETEKRNKYVSIRMALNHQLQHMGEWRVSDIPNKLVFGGNGKRYHRSNTCVQSGSPVCVSREHHVFAPRPLIAYKDYNGSIPKSHPYLLPWRDDASQLPDKELIIDLLWVDPDDLGEDEEWLNSLVKTQL